MFIKELFTTKFIKEYFHRNKYLILLSAVIFLVSVLLGVFFSESFKQLATEIIKQMLEEIPMETVSGNAISLLIISLFAILVNGILIGYVSTLMSPIVFLIGTVPHGIFELTAIVLSLTGAFIITKMEIVLIQALFSKTFEEKKEDMKVYLKDVLFTVIITVILLLIAAIIEAAVTPVLLNMVI